MHSESPAGKDEHACVRAKSPKQEASWNISDCSSRRLPRLPIEIKLVVEGASEGESKAVGKGRGSGELPSMREKDHGDGVTALICLLHSGCCGDGDEGLLGRG